MSKPINIKTIGLSCQVFSSRTVDGHFYPYGGRYFQLFLNLITSLPFQKFEFFSLRFDEPAIIVFTWDSGTSNQEYGLICPLTSLF